MKIVRVPGDASKKLEVALKNLSGKVGKVGWFEKSKYPPSQPVKSGFVGARAPMPVAYVASIQEYGDPAKNIPPRSFMRTTIIEKRVEWTQIAYKGSLAVLKGNSNSAAVMEALGLKAAGDIRKKISLIQEPPLRPSTITARLRARKNKRTVGLLTKPLIDTGLMQNTCINTVEDE